MHDGSAQRGHSLQGLGHVVDRKVGQGERVAGTASPGMYPDLGALGTSLPAFALVLAAWLECDPEDARPEAQSALGIVSGKFDEGRSNRCHAPTQSIPGAGRGHADAGRVASPAEIEGGEAGSGRAGNVAALMARDWRDLFIIEGAPPPVEPAAPPTEERRIGRFRRLRESLRKTRQALQSEIQATLFEELTDETWERLEEALIYADVGAQTTAQVVEQLEREVTENKLSGGQALSDRLVELLTEIADTGDNRIELLARPTVILVAGVNGTGKTTTIGKLAWHLSRELDRSVVLGAGDTFRAAAVEQLELWAQRAGVEFVRGQPEADPGSVAYDAITVARRDGADVVIIDTAGRLHTQDDLMAELAKVRRVIAKQIPEAPHESLLTIDATTGQNGLRQARLFSEAAAVTGLVLTKLDGTAKGGIALAIAHELGIPVKLIGVGEQLEDLRPFDAGEFARALIT
jgi:fused signal recognition particle receptor